DSLMSGPLLVRLRELMEACPRTGIIQTSPRLARGKTLFQRIMQFSTQLCGPMFSAGSNFWQQGSGAYWGHNAIIRLRPFMQQCAIPELPANSPLGRRILSHDSIEAALMQKAGYDVWFAYDLEGGYEECPPSLPEALARDRRWCFGNLQHLYFLFVRQIRTESRFHLLNGIMAYAGSLIWLVFLLVSTIMAIGDHDTRSTGGIPFEGKGALLLAYVMTLLFLPKILGLALVLEQQGAGDWGGRFKMMLSVLGEMTCSVLLAPILMLFHARFVVAALLGAKVSWGTQQRSANRSSWLGALVMFGPVMLIVLAWAGLVLWLKPAFLTWLSLVLIGPLLSIPLSLLLGSSRWGWWARQKGWFVVPQESAPDAELRQMEAPIVTQATYIRSRKFAADYGLMRVILDPYVNAIHISMLRQQPVRSRRTRSYIDGLTRKILVEGPSAMDDREKRHLIWDAEAIAELHHRLWSSPASELAEWWQDALRHYNDVSAFSIRKTIVNA
ncbi:MAG TPA: glucans biosynthesis glucosyltransferase MdoH, partial [Candidatus Limnocylindria bacterium]|nr:glucans biosynthesis glucosyltransferase MdoH [Candidatus Limnocylindria bacterium]